MMTHKEWQAKVEAMSAAVKAEYAERGITHDDLLHMRVGATVTKGAPTPSLVASGAPTEARQRTKVYEGSGPAQDPAEAAVEPLAYHGGDV